MFSYSRRFALAGEYFQRRVIASVIWRRSSPRHMATNWSSQSTMSVFSRTLSVWPPRRSAPRSSTSFGCDTAKAFIEFHGTNSTFPTRHGRPFAAQSRSSQRFNQARQSNAEVWRSVAIHIRLKLAPVVAASQATKSAVSHGDDPDIHVQENDGTSATAVESSLTIPPSKHLMDNLSGCRGLWAGLQQRGQAQPCTVYISRPPF